MPTDSCWLMLLLVVVLGWLAEACWRRQSPRQRTTAIATQIQRLLKPRTPHDCPACRQQALAPTGNPPTRPPVTPWSEINSHRGAPKHINTDGFACPNRMCVYYRITDRQIHAPLWRRHRRAARTHPDVPVSGLWHHLQRAPPYPALLP